MQPDCCGNGAIQARAWKRLITPRRSKHEQRTRLQTRPACTVLRDMRAGSRGRATQGRACCDAGAAACGVLDSESGAVLLCFSYRKTFCQGMGTTLRSTRGEAMKYRPTPPPAPRAVSDEGVKAVDQMIRLEVPQRSGPPVGHPLAHGEQYLPPSRCIQGNPEMIILAVMLWALSSGHPVVFLACVVHFLTRGCK